MTDLSHPDSLERLIVEAAARILRDYARAAEAWHDHAGTGDLLASRANGAADEIADVLWLATRQPLSPAA